MNEPNYPYMCGSAEGAASCAIIDLKSIVRMASGKYGEVDEHLLGLIVKTATSTIANLERMLRENNRDGQTDAA